MNRANERRKPKGRKHLTKKCWKGTIPKSEVVPCWRWRFSRAETASEVVLSSGLMGMGTMEFTLHYRGILKANRGAAEKQTIRRVFHPQIKKMWDQLPLIHFHDLLKPRKNEGDVSLLRTVGAFTFAPLVAEEIKLVAELQITILRPEPPGHIITQGGDIDNRLKTLLDALKMPSEPNALPSGVFPETGESPFFCLLEDDNLITKLSVETDRLLEPVSSPSEVELLVKVRTRQLIVLFATNGMG